MVSLCFIKQGSGSFRKGTGTTRTRRRTRITTRRGSKVFPKVFPKTKMGMMTTFESAFVLLVVVVAAMTLLSLSFDNVSFRFGDVVDAFVAPSSAATNRAARGSIHIISSTTTTTTISRSIWRPRRTGASPSASAPSPSSSSSSWALHVGPSAAAAGSSFSGSSAQQLPSLDALSNKLLLHSTNAEQALQQQQQQQATSGLSSVSSSMSLQLTEMVQAIGELFQRQTEEVWSHIGRQRLPATFRLDKLPISSSVEEALANLQDNVQKFAETVLERQQLLQFAAPEYNSGGGYDLRGEDATGGGVVRSFSDLIGHIPMYLQNHPTATVVISALITYSSIQYILQWGQPPPPSQPYPLRKYDPMSARQYFDARPWQVVTRQGTIVTKSLWFALQLGVDKLRGGGIWEQNQSRRGMELAALLTELGPTFIKVGQSLSIRSDLLSPSYIRGLASLQDQVPAFDSRVAQQIMEQEWGVNNIGDVLVETELPSRPVAAASLGQVYKVTLKNRDDGKSTPRQVAIKVQRPDITTQIALDMHLLREFAPLAKQTFNLNTDTVGTVDAWGKGFVDELDYYQEAKNAQHFLDKIKLTPLKDVVLAPEVVDEYTSSTCLMTEWIDGQRLDRSTKEDVTILCSICMNTYLSMLLEMGILHCDPHPGNLLRTPDGKLAILDWGMVTAIPPQLQLTLIEHMAHLTSGDYAEVPRDLLLLGFVPEDKADVIEDSGVVDVLANIYGAWTSGGGLATINANDVLQQLQDLAGKKGNLFQIPPYFAYIAKSFSVLEGIGLSNDPNYSIINECLPYVSNRLLTDKDSMGNALNTFVFGPDKSNFGTRLVDFKRVEQLVTGFGSFAATVAVERNIGDRVVHSRTEMLESVADQLLDVILTEEETPLQEIVNEQLAKILAASTRTLWSEARTRSGVLPTGRTVLGTIVDPLGVFQTSPLVNTNDQDERTMELTMKLIELLRSQNIRADGSDGSLVVAGIDLSSLDQEEVMVFSRFLTGKIWDRRIALVRSSNRFWNKLLQVTASRLENGERVPVLERRQTIGNSAPGSSSSSSWDVQRSGNEKLNETDRLLAARDLLGVFQRQQELAEEPTVQGVNQKD